MKQKNSSIKVSQLFCMLYICQIIINMTYNAHISNSENTTDYILSFILSYLITFIIIIPIYLLYNGNTNKNLADNSIYYLGKFGYVVVFIYAVYFLCVCIYNFAFYNNYISNIMTPKISVILISISIIACSLYGTFKGIDGLAKTSGIIFILLIAGFLFLICAMMPSVKIYNFTPFLYEGTETLYSQTKTMMTHSPCIAIMSILLPIAKGNVKKGIFFWNTGVYLTLILLTIVMVGALGDYIKTQMFPLYALSGIARIGIFKRMDSLFIAIWTSGLFIKIAVFLYCFSICIKKLSGEKWAKISLFIGAILIAIISLVINFNGDIYFFIQNEYVFLIFTLLTIFFIPLILLAIQKINYKKEGTNK